MTGPYDAPEVLVRARSGPLTTGTVLRGSEIRRRSDRRRRLQWVAGVGACTMLVGAGLVVPLAVAVGEEDQTAVDPAGEPDETPSFGFGLPIGWEVQDRPSTRRTCVGPDSAPLGACSVEIVLAEDPTVRSDALAGILEVLDRCRPGDYEFLSITAEAQGDPPASTFTGRCTRDDPLTTLVSLDSGSAYVRTSDEELAPELAGIVASFTVPDDWAEAPPPIDTEQPTEQPSAEPQEWPGN